MSLRSYAYRKSHVCHFHPLQLSWRTPAARVLVDFERANFKEIRIFLNQGKLYAVKQVSWHPSLVYVSPAKVKIVTTLSTNEIALPIYYNVLFFVGATISSFSG